MGFFNKNKKSWIPGGIKAAGNFMHVQGELDIYNLWDSCQ